MRKRSIFRRLLVRFRCAIRNQTYRGLAFLTVAVVAVGFAWKQPSGNKYNFAYLGVNDESTKIGTDERIAVYTWWLAIFTGVLAVSTVGLWIVTWRSARSQSLDMQRSLRIANRQARTAERTLIELERPWVFLQGATIRRRDLPGTGITPNYFWVKLRWKNIGRAPALIEECLFQFVYMDQLPPEPIYRKEAGFSCPSSVTVDGEIDTNEVGPPSGENKIYVLYGRLAYKELNGTIRHTGYAIEISPHMTAFSPYGGDNEDKYVYYT